MRALYWLMLVIAGFSANDALAKGCLVEGIYYDAKGFVYGCEGGGNWCAGAPPQPGICDRTVVKTVPPKFLGQWSYASGVCRGSSFKLHSAKVEYQAALEPLGTGRVVAVDATNRGDLTIQTILAGKGKFLSIWPTKEHGIYAFGYGSTKSASRKEHCQVMKLK
jgi:hypothetical protein